MHISPEDQGVVLWAMDLKSPSTAHVEASLAGLSSVGSPQLLEAVKGHAEHGVVGGCDLQDVQSSCYSEAVALEPTQCFAELLCFLGAKASLPSRHVILDSAGSSIAKLRHSEVCADLQALYRGVARGDQPQVEGPRLRPAVEPGMQVQLEGKASHLKLWTIKAITSAALPCKFSESSYMPCVGAKGHRASGQRPPWTAAT
mmetsp:Transcript_125531/g.304938  ORF Transcript_125531/g.304938 Transcript_125531/m.304938 type:complete len:201 (-) Transcript_125531:20-622(-)